MIKKINEKATLLIRQSLRKMFDAFHVLNGFETILYEEYLHMDVRHGNFGGDATIISIKSCFNLGLNESMSLQEINAIIQNIQPKIVLYYSCREGTGELNFKFNEIKLDKKKRFLKVDYMLSQNPGYPSYFGIKNLQSFFKLKKALRNCYRAAGLPQKGFVI